VRLAEFLLVMKIAQLDVIFSKHFNWSAGSLFALFFASFNLQRRQRPCRYSSIILTHDKRVAIETLCKTITDVSRVLLCGESKAARLDGDERRARRCQLDFTPSVTFF
jgi:hypothetical protein